MRMSSTSLVPPDTSPPPTRATVRVAAVATALLLLLGTLLFPSPAQAADHGPGFGEGLTFIGAYVSHSRQAYCMDLDATPPGEGTQAPELTTALDGLSRQQLAELNYVMGRWGDSADPTVTAAVQLYVWWVADAPTYASRGGDPHFFGLIPDGSRDQVTANLAMMRDAAPRDAVIDPSINISVATAEQYRGTVTVQGAPASLTGKVTLTGGTFEDGTTEKILGAGDYPVIGTPPEGAPEYRIGASITTDAVGYGAGVDLFYTPGAQRILGTATFAPLTATAESPVIPLDFQPVIETQVSSKFVQAGDPFTDQLAVTVTKHSWINVNGTTVPVLAEGTLYGPFDTQPAEANAPPAGAPVLGTESLTLTDPGTYMSPGSLVAPASGFYTWVWSIDKQTQGENTKYLTDSFTDRFGRVAETSVAPFQPEAVSKANGRLVKPGDAVTDTITVSSTNGAWLKQNGAPIPVVFEGTAYQVPGSLPPAQGAEIPEVAVSVGTVQVVAEGPGTYTSPAVTLPDAGFVTWAWEVKKASQPEWVRPLLAADWRDDYGINVETHSVRWPVTITSEVHEYNVHKGGRAFDRITVAGFPDNHPDFDGDGYWGPDRKELTHTVYGPFATDTELTAEMPLEDAPVLTRITTPAKNGVYDIGYTDEDAIRPAKPGYYVIVTSFEGDDRVHPFVSSPADIWERFFVPGPEQPVSVVTQAQESAFVGDPFSDTALVQGTDIPKGTYLVFRAYGPQPAGDTPVCEVPFFASAKVPVTQAGHYRSGETTVKKPGNVYWVETLYDKDGKVLAAGKCGAPGETTVVAERPPGTPPTPSTPQPPLPKPPTSLAETGSDGWMSLVWGGIAAALLATGGTLWFGRKLALYRERNGYVREEDTGIDDLMNK